MYLAHLGMSIGKAIMAQVLQPFRLATQLYFQRVCEMFPANPLPLKTQLSKYPNFTHDPEHGRSEWKSPGFANRLVGAFLLDVLFKLLNQSRLNLR